MPGPNSTLLFAGDGFSRALGERHRAGNLWVVWSDLEPPSHPARFWGWIQGPDGEGTVRAVANPLPDETHTNVRVDIYLRVRAEDAGAFETIERRRVREGHALLGSVLFNREEPLLVGELAAALKGGVAIAAADFLAATAIRPVFERARATLPEEQRAAHTLIEGGALRELELTFEE